MAEGQGTGRPVSLPLMCSPAGLDETLTLTAGLTRSHRTLEPYLPWDPQPTPAFQTPDGPELPLMSRTWSVTSKLFSLD